MKKSKFFQIAAAVLFLFCAAEARADKKGDVTTITGFPSTLVYPSYWHTPFGLHRGTPFWLKVFLGTRTNFNNPQDLAATKLLVDFGKINKGRDDWQLTVYGVNSGNGEVIYNPSMHALALFGSKGDGKGQLMNPTGIACNEYGDIYVADTGNNRISRWFNDGKQVRFIRNIGEEGSEKGQFLRPAYVELDSMGRIYVSDTGNNRIQIFDKSGGLIRVLDSKNGLSDPTGIAVTDENERYTGYRANKIFCIDAAGTRVLRFTHEGKLEKSVRIDNIVQKDVKLTTLDLDYFGNVYAVDRLNSRIYKLNSDLDFIAGYGKHGTQDYEFDSPTGIAIYKHYGQVFISDRESAQYFWLGADVLNFTAKQIKPSEFQFEFLLTERATITIDIEIQGGNIEVCSRLCLEQGRNQVMWSVPPDFDGTLFKKGESYPVSVRAMATYSSYPHIQKLVRTMIFYE